MVIFDVRSWPSMVFASITPATFKDLVQPPPPPPEKEVPFPEELTLMPREVPRPGKLKKNCQNIAL